MVLSYELEKIFGKKARGSKVEGICHTYFCINFRHYGERFAYRKRSWH